MKTRGQVFRVQKPRVLGFENLSQSTRSQGTKPQGTEIPIIVPSIYEVHKMHISQLRIEKL